MSQRVTVERAMSKSLETDLRRVRQLAQLMDAKFKIAGYPVGWDAIVGLLPVFGDVATAMVGLYPIMIARKHNLGQAVQRRMALNVFVDWAVGEIPLIGDLFDVAFKSNLRNADLLERAAQDAMAEP
jgi:hypothetical protein